MRRRKSSHSPYPAIESNGWVWWFLCNRLLCEIFGLAVLALPSFPRRASATGIISPGVPARRDTPGIYRTNIHGRYKTHLAAGLDRRVALTPPPPLEIRRFPSAVFRGVYAPYHAVGVYRPAVLRRVTKPPPPDHQSSICNHQFFPLSALHPSPFALRPHPPPGNKSAPIPKTFSAPFFPLFTTINPSIL